MKGIALLGSTGSIGVNSLDVINNLNFKYRLIALTANRSYQKLAEQALQYKPQKVVICDTKYYQPLKDLLKDTNIEVLAGKDAILDIISMESVDVCINALVGSAGLLPTVKTLEEGKYLALANKESLVMAGDIVMRMAKKTNSVVYPIDSEHSAMWQVLSKDKKENIKKIYLTASGGPFRNRQNNFENITVEEALRHPNWEMGHKITIDSATMMNKGFEMIEAVHFFDVHPDQIKILVHPQSIIHSMVEYCDNSIIAQLGIADMRIPIQYALTYPERYPINLSDIDFFDIARLDFQKPDFVKFPAMRLAYESIKAGGTYPVVLNAVNEIMVDKFLNKEISFTDIAKNIEIELNNHDSLVDPSLQEILEINRYFMEKLSS